MCQVYNHQLNNTFNTIGLQSFTYGFEVCWGKEAMQRAADAFGMQREAQVSLNSTTRPEFKHYI